MYHPQPIPKGLPRKGILKRSNSAQERGREDASDVITPLPSEGGVIPVRGYTPPQANIVGEDGKAQTSSRIPRLSVSWWETSSVCGEAPRSAGGRHRREGSSDDDDMSVTSATNSINGTWWFGRQTRFVPHCERRHLHGEEQRPYLTPTQRKNREVAELRRQLRQAHQLLDDKDKHLGQLRERLTELENLMDSPGGLPETGKLMMRLNRMEVDHEREKRDLTTDYERRILVLKRSLEKANVCLPPELGEPRKKEPKTARARDERTDSGVSGTELGPDVGLEPFMRPRRNTADSATMTSSMERSPPPTTNEIEQIEREFEQSKMSRLLQELDAYKYECAILRNKVAEFEARESNKTLRNDMDSISTEDSHHQCIKHNCLSQKQEMAAQIQAYKKECMVWRTKAAELEISMKQKQAAEYIYGSPTRQNNQANQVRFDPVKT